MALTVAVDCMGGDYAPLVPVRASYKFASENPDVSLILVGDTRKIKSLLPGKVLPNLFFANAKDEVGMGETPSRVIRKKPDSSLHVAAKLVKRGKADAMFSVGNTGAIVAISIHIMGLRSSVFKPALAILYPTYVGSDVALLDLGATVDPSAEALYGFARMGAAFFSALKGESKPRVRFLNVGTEDIKGTPRLKEARELTEKDGGLNFKGYIEGNELFIDPDGDVVVTDGFTGNVTLKVIEGLSDTFFKIYSQKLKTWGFMFKMPEKFIKKMLLSTVERYHYSFYGAAVLLGVNGFVAIGHGRSNELAFESGLSTVATYLKNDFSSKFKAFLDEF